MAQSKPIISLQCSVCGQETIGRQWFNRDKGFGVCSPCIEWVKEAGESPEEIIANYGLAGVHYGIQEKRSPAAATAGQ